MLPSLISIAYVTRHIASIAVSALLAGAVAAAPLTVNVVGADGRPLEDAVVEVEVRGAPISAPAGTAVDIEQRQRNFRPRVIAIQAGTLVSFPNFDTVRHHVYSYSPIAPVQPGAKFFEIKLYVGRPEQPVVFDKPGTAVMGCQIHDLMRAYLRVVSTPYFAKTNAQGVAQLEVPAGEHRLQAWHALLGDAPPHPQALKLPSGGASLTLTVAAP